MEFDESSPVHSSGIESGNSIENETIISFWDYTNSLSIGGIICAIVLIYFIIRVHLNVRNSNNNESTSTLQTILSNLSLTVGMIGLAVASTLVEQYLRILSNFYTSSSTSTSQSNDDEVDSKIENGRPWKISYTNILRHLSSFGQRLLTLKAALIIITMSEWNHTIIILVSSTMLIPRILFSLFIIKNLRDPTNRSHPNNPSRAVNMSLMLLHYTYKGFKHFFKVLSGIEGIIFFISKQFQFISMQFLGYSYDDKFICIFGNIETIFFIGWNIFIGSNLCTDIIYIFCFLLIIFLRLSCNLADSRLD